MIDPAWIIIFIGALIIMSRGPLIFAPITVRNFYFRMLANNLRVRLFGLFLLALGLGMIFLVKGQTVAALVITGFGYFLCGVSVLFFLILASVIGLVMREVLKAMDSVVLRLTGALAVLLGIFLIWAGIRLL